MPERLRTLAARLRSFVGSRRREPRYKTRLAASVSLAGVGAAASQSLSGHTRDVSQHGLGLVLPAVRLGGRYLTNEGQTLIVTLQLPDAPVRLRGTVVRYERLEEGDVIQGYLVGLRLAEEDDPDRRQYVEYIRKGVNRES
jgi:hypothetical protein